MYFKKEKKKRFVKTPPSSPPPPPTKGIGLAKGLFQGLVYKLVTYFHDFHVNNAVIMCCINWNNVFENLQEQ